MILFLVLYLSIFGLSLSFMFFWPLHALLKRKFPNFIAWHLNIMKFFYVFIIAFLAFKFGVNTLIGASPQLYMIGILVFLYLILSIHEAGKPKEINAENAQSVLLGNMIFSILPFIVYVVAFAYFISVFTVVVDLV